MSLTVAQIKKELFPWGLRVLSNINFDHYLDTDLINDINQVQRQLNIEAELHQERYHETGIDADTTTIQVQRAILNVLYFKFKTANANENKTWNDQRYTYVGDVIVLKNSTIANDEVDILYQGDTSDIAGADTDEVDLPTYALAEFRTVLKEQIKYQVGVNGWEQMQKALLFSSERLRLLKPVRALDMIPVGQGGDWGRWSTSDDQYNITRQWVSQDSVTADWSGAPFFA